MVRVNEEIQSRLCPGDLREAQPGHTAFYSRANCDYLAAGLVDNTDSGAERRVLLRGFTHCARVDPGARSPHSSPMNDDLFFVARNGSIWACWLSGKPAVNLGGECAARAAMEQFLGENRPALTSGIEKPPAPPPPMKSTLAPPPAPRTVMERSADRHEIAIVGRIFTAGGSRDVVITDLSETGCQFTDEAEVLESGNRLTIKIGPIGPLEAATRWRRAERIGIEFTTRLYPSVLDHIRQHFDLRER